MQKLYNTDERNKKDSMFLDQKNQHDKNNNTTQNNMQTQCKPYQFWYFLLELEQQQQKKKKNHNLYGNTKDLK